MTDTDIIDMQEEEGETEKHVAKFQTHIEAQLAKWKQANPGMDPQDAPWGTFIRKALFNVLGGTFTKIAICGFLGDVCMLVYIYSIMYLINYIKDPEAETQEAVIVCSGFTLLVFTAIMFKNKSLDLGFRLGINMRKILIASMYDKLGKLSIKSLTSTNSGKLVTLASADIFMVEKGLAFSPLLISAPLINLLVWILVGIMEGWLYSLVIFLTWVLMIILQNLSAKAT
jgi:ABC-type transport system involved in cytochrome bd biosynthesis fused ATPase/permease subunit